MSARRKVRELETENGKEEERGAGGGRRGWGGRGEGTRGEDVAEEEDEEEEEEEEERIAMAANIS